jgi:hypothetical protein
MNATSANGTNPTCRGSLTMSVDRENRKGPAHGQSDAIDPLLTSDLVKVRRNNLACVPTT